MASTTETGNQRNVENFQDLIGFYNGFGGGYNPTNNLIKLTAMNTVLTNARNAMDTVNTANNPFINATNMRQEKFAKMKKLATKTVNAFDATEAVTDKMVDDARTFVRKIRGVRTAKINPLNPVSISVSQQSYDNLYKHFKSLVSYVKSEPTYNPNENELKGAQLDAFANDLKAANKLVNDTFVPLSNAIKQRNKTLYGIKTGLVDRALESKKYVKSAYGGNSAEYNQIKGIKFSRPRKK